jgi:hypothetical protein
MKTSFRSAIGFEWKFPFANPVQIQIFYANNATNISAQTALTTSWIGPSITPLTNLNSGFRVYEVDSAVRVVTYFLTRSLLFGSHPLLDI